MKNVKGVRKVVIIVVRTALILAVIFSFLLSIAIGSSSHNIEMSTRERYLLYPVGFIIATIASFIIPIKRKAKL